MPERLPAPPRGRRPALAGLALVMILAGALGSALVAYRSGNRVDVLVMARDVDAGHRIGAADFTTARVASDGGQVIPATSRSRFVGSVAVASIPAGALVSPLMFLGASSVVPDDATVVGFVLSPAQRPARTPVVGDVVRLYALSRAESSADTTSAVLLDAARVAEVGQPDSGARGLAISVLVPTDSAESVVAAASANRVAVTRLAPEVSPSVDFRRS